ELLCETAHWRLRVRLGRRGCVRWIERGTDALGLGRGTDDAFRLWRGTRGLPGRRGTGGARPARTTTTPTYSTWSARTISDEQLRFVVRRFRDGSFGGTWSLRFLLGRRLRTSRRTTDLDDRVADGDGLAGLRHEARHYSAVG